MRSVQGLAVTPPSVSKSVWRSGWNPSPRPVASWSASPPPGWSITLRCSVRSEMVSIKGADAPVPARRLVAMEQHRGSVGRSEATLVGANRKSQPYELLDRSMSGHGGVVGVVGPRVSARAAWCARLPRSRLHAVSTSSGPSASPLPARSPCTSFRSLLRAATRIGELDGAGARAQVRARFRRRRRPRICCCSTICSASPIPTLRRRPYRSGCPPAATDRTGQCRLARPRRPRRSSSSRTSSGSTRSASQCWPTSLR